MAHHVVVEVVPPHEHDGSLVDAAVRAVVPAKHHPHDRIGGADDQEPRDGTAVDEVLVVRAGGFGCVPPDGEAAEAITRQRALDHDGERGTRRTPHRRVEHVETGPDEVLTGLSRCRTEAAERGDHEIEGTLSREVTRHDAAAEAAGAAVPLVGDGRELDDLACAGGVEVRGDDPRLRPGLVVRGAHPPRRLGRVDVGGIGRRVDDIRAVVVGRVGHGGVTVAVDGGHVLGR